MTLNNEITLENILPTIFVVRGVKAMLDSDIAALYGVETRQVNQAVKRNMERFPSDFMFQLSKEEMKLLKSQSVTSRWGGRRTAPNAFTEQGIAMLSGVLKSERAIKVNIAIIRSFIKLRKMITQVDDLKLSIDHLRYEYDEKFGIVFETLNKMVEAQSNKKPIGFIWPQSNESKDKAKK